MSKLVNLLTKEVYDNRLEAKLSVGSSRFNKLFRTGKIIFIDKETKDLITSLDI